VADLAVESVGVRRVDVGDVELAIAESGIGGRPCLLVHGFGAAKEDFTPWLPELAARGWHVVAPDLRGHGASDGPSDESRYSLATMAADVVGLLDALGWERAVMLGHSAGGPVVQHVVAAAPHRVGGLVLMDTWTGPFDGIDPELIELAAKVARTEGMAALADMQDALDEAPLDTPAYLALCERDPSHKDFGRRKLVACAPQMWAAMAEQLPGAPDMTSVLTELSGRGVPSLVIVGEQDTPFLEHSERLAAALGTRCAVIADAGHGPQFEATDAWWAELTGFLEAL
jgi:pimeloyl-ACP methyl ester carboxylesterase